MKKWMIAVILPLFLLGCGQASRAETSALALRERFNRSSGCAFDAGITADYGDKIYTFAMGCQVDAHGNLLFTVAEPEPIRGIAGKIDAAGGQLTFEDHALGFELMAGERLSPVSAPWIVTRAILTGYIEACDEKQLTLRDSFEEDGYLVELYLGDDGVPVAAEIYWEGRRILTLELENFRFL